MSHILNFHVDGLITQDKSFGAELNRDINIFFGLNGSGKTSILRILNSALAGNASLISNVPFKKAEVTIQSIDFDKQFTYKIERSAPAVSKKRQSTSREFADVEVETELPMEIFIGPDGLLHRKQVKGSNWSITPSLPQGARGAWQHKFLPTSRLISKTPSKNSQLIDSNEDFYDTYFAMELERHWNGFFGSVQADVRKIQEQGIASILAELFSSKHSTPNPANFDLEKAYDRASAFLKRQNLSSALPTKKVFQERIRDHPVLQSVVEKINNLEEKILYAMEKRTKLQSLVERLFTGGKRLVLGDTSVEMRGINDTKIGLQSLSSGEKHILRILFEVMGSGRSSLIIDEPELSLHIDWQRELIKAIMELNPELQLIVATHSPEIMAEFDDSKIFRIPN
jgi:predicted ATP-dependent endonuclease of OLD family